MSIRLRMDSFPVLEGSNYVAWSGQIRDRLIFADLYGALDPKGKAEDGTVAKALAFIRSSVSVKIRAQLEPCTTAAEAWQVLEERYRQRSKAAVLQVQQQLLSILQEPGESVLDYRARAEHLWAEAVAGGAAIEEGNVVLALLAGVRAELKVVASILRAQDCSSLDKAELALQAAEPLIGASSGGGGRRDARDVVALHARANGSGPTCWHCNEIGHLKRNCPVMQKAKALKEAHARYSTSIVL